MGFPIMETGLHLDSAIPVFGRIATLAGVYRIDLTSVIDRIGVLAPELSDLAMVTVPHTFDRIAITTQLVKGGDGLDRALALSNACDPEQSKRLAILTSSDTHEVNLEVESLPGDKDGFAVTVQAFGKRSLVSDLDRLQRFGVAMNVATHIGALAQGLGDRPIGLTDRGDTTGARAWTLHVLQPNRDDAQRAATRERLTTVATALGVTAAQKNVIAGLHDALAGDRDSYAWLRIRSGETTPILGLVWANLAWEHVVRMMTAFYPTRDTSNRLGELSGATGANVAAAIELILGPTEPPRMSVAVTLEKGRTPS